VEGAEGPRRRTTCEFGSDPLRAPGRAKFCGRCSELECDCDRYESVDGSFVFPFTAIAFALIQSWCAADLHFHDLRREGITRFIEGSTDRGERKESTRPSC
jgi:hypothetical protein